MCCDTLYHKTFSYAKEAKKERTHLKKLLVYWMKWCIYYNLLEKQQDNMQQANEFLTQYNREDYYELLQNIKLFEQIYVNKAFKDLYFWTEEEFNSFVHSAGPNIKCSYCGQSPQTLKSFYHLLESDNWTRGRNFEIDRKYSRLKSYFSDASKRGSFLSGMQHFIETCSNKSSLFGKLKNALNREAFLYLPAPYNRHNCVFACYWCNNAKTDAFNEAEFSDIGKAIGQTINKIVRDKS